MLSMLEPWEKVLMVTIFTVSFVFVVAGLFKYLPHHLDVMHHRAVYYLWGQDGDARQWFGLGQGVGDGVRGLFKEL